MPSKAESHILERAVDGQSFKESSHTETQLYGPYGQITHYFLFWFVLCWGVLSVLWSSLSSNLLHSQVYPSTPDPKASKFGPCRLTLTHVAFSGLNSILISLSVSAGCIELCLSLAGTLEENS